MISLHYPKHFQAVQRPPFCYLCGQALSAEEPTNRDHIPPKNLFAAKDRTPPLILHTHPTCNSAHKLVDEKVGQLVGIRRGVAPSDPKNHRLKFEWSEAHAAVTNIDLHGAIWRWVRGFHAALYRQPLADDCRRAIETPLPMARRAQHGSLVDVPLRAQQHRVFVETIKTNRARQNVDRIRSNNGKMTYECVWTKNEAGDDWFCIFALDVYAWKDLGDPRFGHRGCAGTYSPPAGLVPEGAAREQRSPILVPNFNPLDPFGR